MKMGAIEVVTILMSILVMGDPAAAQPAFVPGEILVRFAPGSAGMAAVEKALQAGSPGLRALDPAVADLSTAARIPLQASRVAGGNWVVIAVRTDELARQTADRLRTHRNVEAVEELSPGSGLQPPGRSAQGLAIRFRPRSPESAVLEKALSGEPDDHAARLAGDLAVFVALPLRGLALDGPRLRVDIDVPALTPVLLERLRPLKDIQSVQPNYVLGIRPPP